MEGSLGVEYGENISEGKRMCNKLWGGKGVWHIQTTVRRPE